MSKLIKLMEGLSKQDLVKCIEAFGYLEIKKLKTEDTGKMLEMAICLAYDIPYQGNYKYDKTLPERLKIRLEPLVNLFPSCVHTAEKGARYDYTTLDGKHHLSAKSTKKGLGKVSPQVIGQPSPKKFCDIMGIEFEGIPKLKEYIQKNITDIIPVLVNYTFDCPNIYYNQEMDTLRFITLITPINWNLYNYKWTVKWDVWNNSSTLKIVTDQKDIAILEFQFHTKSRKNIVIRWVYENFLNLFKNHLEIINL